jgi:hypothetical protein
VDLYSRVMVNKQPATSAQLTSQVPSRPVTVSMRYTFRVVLQLLVLERLVRLEMEFMHPHVSGFGADAKVSLEAGEPALAGRDKQVEAMKAKRHVGRKSFIGTSL